MQSRTIATARARSGSIIVPQTGSVQIHKAWLRFEAPAPNGVWQQLGPDRPVLFVVPPRVCASG